MDQDVGARLRAARVAAGVSITRLAALTDYSRCHLSNIENGRRCAAPEVVLAYERALGDDMNRRDLITGLGATILAPILAHEAILGSLTKALGPRESVEYWWARADAYGRDYMTMGAEQMASRLMGEMVQLQRYVDDRHVWAPAANLMTVYGKTLRNNVGRDGAIRTYRLASIMADRSGDLPTRVWVRGRAALALAYEGAEGLIAAQLAEQALSLSKRPSIARLNAAIAKMHVVSERSDAKAAKRALESAQRIFDRAGSSEQVSDFAMPEWRWAIHRSMMWSRQGREREALAAQAEVDRLRPAELTRFATHVELHRGLMLAKSGDKPAGVEYAREALHRLPASKRSLSLDLMMREVVAA